MTVTSKSPISHFPVAPLPAAAPITVPSVAGNAPRVVPAVPASGPRTLTLGQGSVKIDPTSHSPQNVVDIINNGNIAGVSAALDRYGNLVITGVNAATGDPLLLQHLGLN